MSLCINPHCANPENQDTSLFCQSCSSEILLDGRYRILRQLGGGGFGKTYEARDCAPNQSNSGANSLKVLKALIHNHPKYVELFQREAQFLSRLNHPGIPHVEPDAYFTFFPHKSAVPLYCLVMEKIEGLDLKEYISRRGSCISQKRAIQWLIQLMGILQEIHSHNFFHRDIKPSNIMLRSDGQLVLIDFGTAREVTETYLSKQSSGQVTGLFSAGYSPLEQLNGQAVPQSDFFALGRTFVYLLTGKPPSDFYDSYEDQIKWRESVSELSLPFADFLDHLMARLPSQRPQSANEIIQKLEALYRNLYVTDITSQTRFPTAKAANFTEQKTVTTPPGSQPPQTVAPTPTTPPKPPQQALTVEPVATTIPHPGPLMDAGFIARCQQELAQLIGPMASIICQRILSKNSQLSAADFVKALAQKIPDPQQAQEFQKRLLKYQ